MSKLLDGIEAVVLRTTRFGEADLIAHVHTREQGRRGVIAKGALRAKSRLGVRLDPFLTVRLNLVEGRGDLAIVRGVEVIEPVEQLRASWRKQQTAAAALDLVNRIGVEHEPNEPLHNLLRSFLVRLDAAPDDELVAAALLRAFQLKVLHVTGTTPQLAACVRCGDTTALGWFSARDGGVVCSTCREPGDAGLDADAHAAAVHLMQRSFADLLAVPADELPSLATLRVVERVIVVPTLAEHAGVTLR